jgi:hypothetical protein
MIVLRTRDWGLVTDHREILESLDWRLRTRDWGLVTDHREILESLDWRLREAATGDW